jgi:general secretion pathway protein K
MINCKQQTGVALVTALLVVAIAVVLATTLVDELHLDLRRTENMIHNEQTYLYTLGAENMAQAMLEQDAKDSKYDSLQEIWAIQRPPWPVEGGYVAGQLMDLQGRFNLNNLSQAINNQFEEDIDRFKRLLKELELEPNLADAVIDWLDADLVTRIPEGAEDDYYIGLERPYRTANSLMISPSELRLVKGFNQDNVFETLAPFICTLPESTLININTASAEVLKSISEDISSDDVSKIIEYRDGDPELDNAEAFKTLEDFQAYMQQQLDKQNFSTEGMTVSTDYFLLSSQAVIGRGRVQLYSTILRNTQGGTDIIRRSQGSW